MLGWIKFFLHASIETAKAAKMKFKNAVEQVNKYNLYLINKKIMLRVYNIYYM